MLLITCTLHICWAEIKEYCIVLYCIVHNSYLRHGKNSQEDIFARRYFREKLFSREDIYAGRYFRVNSRPIFAKISSRENISN